jgi:hypothetical protein
MRCAMMRLLGSRIVAAAVLLVLSGEGAANDPPLIAQVRAAWKDREDRVRSVRVEWTQRVFVAKGADSDILTAAGLKGVEISPPEDHTYEGNGTLVVDSDKLTVAFPRSVWDSKAKRYRDFPTEVRFDGDRELAVHHRGGDQHPEARLKKAGKGAETPPVVRPLLRAFRGTSTHFRADDLDLYTVTGAVAHIGGHQGHELLCKGGPARIERRLWVDPKRNYVVLRAVSGKPERPKQQVDVQYGPHKATGWVPIGWRIVDTSPDGGRVSRTTTVVVKKCEINGTVDPDTFKLAPPPGTYVINQTREGPREYITRPDGTNRVIGPQDRGKSYDEIMNTPGAEAGGWGLKSRWGLALAIVVGGGCILLLMRVWIARRSSAPGSPPADPPASPEGGVR